EDALVDLLVAAAIAVAAVAAQGMAQLLDGVGYIGQAQELGGEAVAERQGAAFQLDQLQHRAAFLHANGARSPPPDGARFHPARVTAPAPPAAQLADRRSTDVARHRGPLDFDTHENQ